MLDVGCGPGALTAVLASRAGADAVSAVEPSASFAAAARERLPGVDVRQSAAERLPFPDDAFDVALAQLVVHFMTDPVAGLREMARVTRPGGVVAACVWDHAGGHGPVSAFWQAARELDPAADDESGLAGVREGHLAELFTQAGLDWDPGRHADRPGPPGGFESWWETFTLGVGPGRGVPGGPGRRGPGRAARAVPAAAADGPVRGQRHRVGGDRAALTSQPDDASRDDATPMTRPPSCDMRSGAAACWPPWHRVAWCRAVPVRRRDRLSRAGRAASASGRARVSPGSAAGR